MSVLRLLVCLFLAFITPVVVAVEEPLPPDQAFRMQASLQDESTAQIKFDLAPGYYLYLNKFHYRLEPGGTIESTPQYPAGEMHEDKFFGKQTVFRNSFVIRLPLPAQAVGTPTLVVNVQGCSETLGVCYPPTDLPAELKPANMSLASPTSTAPGLLSGISGTAPAVQMDMPGNGTTATAAPPVPGGDNDEDGRIAGLLREGHLLPIGLGFFGFGLLLAFTPCVLPMMPILSGIIVGKGAHISRRRALLLSSAYVSGMAVTYTAAGILAGMTGAALTTTLQNVWVLGSFALIFVLLSLPMFGIFELQMPTALQGRLSTLANRQAGSIGGLATMGAISALIVGPCMTAPLAGALLSIAQSGNARVGGFALFTLALGMGAPLIAVGTLARHWLPRPGPWMDLVNAFFGWLLLATALWILYPVLPPLLLGSLAVALLLVPAVLLIHRGRRVASRPRRVMHVAACLLVVAAFALGGRQIHVSSNAGDMPVFQAVRTTIELDAWLASANKPVLLDFYADWCVSCREMEHYTLREARVRERLQDFTLLRADVTRNTTDDQALLKRFGLYAPPAMLFFNKEVQVARAIGFKDADAFATLLDRARSGQASKP